MRKNFIYSNQEVYPTKAKVHRGHYLNFAVLSLQVRLLTFSCRYTRRQCTHMNLSVFTVRFPDIPHTVIAIP